MTVKDALHEMVDRLSDVEAAAVLAWLGADFAGPRPLSGAETAGVERALAEMDEGRGVSTEALRSRLASRH